MIKKRICAITGTRAEYGLLKILLEKIEQSNKLELLLLVTGMHLLPDFGKTLDIIKRDNIPISKIIPMYEENKLKKEDLGKSLGKAIINFTDVLKELKPDILLVLGDRFEPLAAVLAASTLSIPIAHIHGGDNVIDGQIDEQIRHAITKFAHIHFPVSPKSSQRLRMLGEEDWRINMVGSPGVDMILNYTLLEKKALFTQYGLNLEDKLIVCVFHPYIFESKKAGEQMAIILEALKTFNHQTILLYPNNDPGSDLIIKEIQSNLDDAKFKVFKNLERSHYLSILKNADLLVGNSSSGIIESTVFHLPVVNIGKRNRGRESAENIIDVNNEYEKIIKAIEKGISNEFKDFCKNVINLYGEGKASEKIVEILENIQIDQKLLVKRLNYNI